MELNDDFMAKTKFVGLILLVSLLLLAAISFSVTNVEAQSKATVNVLDSIGGTTDPAAGTYSYNDGASVTFTALPGSAAIFSNWIISTDAGSRQSTDNPLTFPVSGGTTYNLQPVFNIIQPVGSANLPKDNTTLAIVVVLGAAGGTTNPGPGSYGFTNATSLNLTAVPNSGWQFSHWVISGQITSHGSAPVNLEPTNNPYNVNHGYGATYYYQPVFTQTSGLLPSPSVPELSVFALILLIGAMIPVVLVARKHRLTKA